MKICGSIAAASKYMEYVQQMSDSHSRFRVLQKWELQWRLERILEKRFQNEGKDAEISHNWHRISLEGYLRVEKNGKNCTWHHTVRYSKLVRNVQIAKLIIFFLISRYQGSHHSINGEDHRQETDELDLQTQNINSYTENWIRRAFSGQLTAK